MQQLMIPVIEEECRTQYAIKRANRLAEQAPVFEAYCATIAELVTNKPDWHDYDARSEWIYDLLRPVLHMGAVLHGSFMDTLADSTDPLEAISMLAANVQDSVTSLGHFGHTGAVLAGQEILIESFGYTEDDFLPEDDDEDND